MFYDLIIVTKSTPDIASMTQNAINTALVDTPDINVIVVETGNPYKYDNVNKTIEYNGQFNYNRALNLGLSHVKGDVFILCNNDIIFYPGWSKIGELMQLNDYHSASAWAGHLKMYKEGDHIYEGFDVGYTFTGWCLFLDRYCLNKIGKLDESVSFWYSDNLYAMQLQDVGIRHALFCNVRVDHYASVTLKKQPSRVQRQLEIGELGKFNERRIYYAKRERDHKNNT